ncbi:MAG: cation:proton antiporter [Clostridia bacterium]|nr:cation:proton antiporter [Clostridia bacterium]
MGSHLEYVLNFGVILLAANVGGIISRKLKQPAVLGQIIAGIILGMGLMEKTAFIEDLGEIGVIFLMFIAGLETDVQELKSSGKSSSFVALGGVLFPAAFVGGGTYFLTGDWMMALFVGVISTATSVSISVQTLRELEKLRTRQGITILGAAIIDDVVGIVLLTLAIGIVKPSEGGSVAVVIGKIALFFAITLIAGIVVTKLLKYCCDVINLDDKIVTYAVVVCFILAFISEELGVAAITGAYFSGVVFSMTDHRHRLSHEVNQIATIMFTPVFFVSIGMGVDLNSAVSALGLGSVIILLAVLGKIVGCGLGAKLTGFERKEALQIGFGMIPRAEVAIIIANLGLKMGVINHHVMASTILMVLVTTLITPSLLKWSFTGSHVKKAEEATVS